MRLNIFLAVLIAVLIVANIAAHVAIYRYYNLMDEFFVEVVEDAYTTEFIVECVVGELEEVLDVYTANIKSQLETLQADLNELKQKQ